MRDFIDNQYQNLFLYVPFLMAFGAAVYFALPTEPDFMFMPIVTIIMAGCMLIKRIPVILRAVFIFVFGFCWACTYTHAINTPKISRDMHNVQTIGTVENIDFADDKTRLYLSIPADDINAGVGNAVVRMSWRDADNNISIGDKVSVSGGLFMPSSAYVPETFDYARWAYFNNLTAIGYVKDIKVIQKTEQNNINTLRNFLHVRANSFLGDSLILGYKNAVPKDDGKIWTATGIGHVWSISGFHMTLVGGWLFAFFMLIFRSVPYITRRIPAKIPALCCAWFGLGFYLILSGLDVATIRAFLMTTLVFMAFIFGRNAISLRNIALAFCLIFLINPHFVMQAGFQLSFSAVFGLVWLYSVVKPKMPKNKFLKIIYACVLTSVVATVFTAPFVATHFGAIPIYSIIGNLVLLPIFSFAIMPLVLIGVVTSLFGVHAPIDIAHMIYNWTRNMAIAISEMPFSNISVPHISNVALMCFIVAFMALVFIKPIKVKVNYILFGILVSIGVITVYMTPKPIFYASHDNELVAFVDDDGRLEFNKSRASNHYFAFDTWKARNNEPTDTPNKRRKHNQGVYHYKNIVYIQKFVPLMNNINKLCNDDDVRYIVSYFKIDAPKCEHKLLRGGFVIYPDNSVKFIQNNRWWN